MLNLVIITYNDADVIKDCIESVYNKVDHIIAVDGAFIDFPVDNLFSTDGTREYLGSLKKVELLDLAGVDEVTKRTNYLRGNNGDWYLQLDADEVWEGPISIPDADAGIVKCFDGKKYYNRVRLFKHVEGLHYEKKHYWLHDGNGMTFALLDKVGRNYKGEFITDARIIHHNHRSGERYNQKKKYYEILRARERKIAEVV